MPLHIPGQNWTPRIVVEYRPEEREPWEKDAKMLGFPRCGTQYVKWLLNGRAEGRLLIVDPATMNFGRMIGAVLGEVAGEVIAKAERAYLEGK